jgi:hypothetical protein
MALLHGARYFLVTHPTLVPKYRMLYIWHVWPGAPPQCVGHRSHLLSGYRMPEEEKWSMWSAFVYLVSCILWRSKLSQGLKLSLIAFWSYTHRNSARISTVWCFTRVSQSLGTNVGIVLQIRTRPLPSVSFPNNFSIYTDRPRDRRLSAKLVSTSANRVCRVVSATDPHGR